MASSSQSAEEVPRPKQNAKPWSRPPHSLAPPQSDIARSDASLLPPLDPSKVEVKMTGLKGLSNSWRLLPDHVKAQFE